MFNTNEMEQWNVTEERLNNMLVDNEQLINFVKPMIEQNSLNFDDEFLNDW